MEIGVSLDVFKALTARLDYEGHTFDDVLRELLEIDSPVETVHPDNFGFSKLADSLEHFSRSTVIASQGPGFFSRGLYLPDGTDLRARYKGRLYSAKIVGELWLDEINREFLSPSAAASAITGNSVNGWRFWEAKRPSDNLWRRLDALK